MWIKRCDSKYRQKRNILYNYEHNHKSTKQAQISKLQAYVSTRFQTFFQQKSIVWESTVVIPAGMISQVAYLKKRQDHGRGFGGAEHLRTAGAAPVLMMARSTPC